MIGVFVSIHALHRTMIQANRLFLERLVQEKAMTQDEATYHRTSFEINNEHVIDYHNVSMFYEIKLHPSIRMFKGRQNDSSTVDMTVSTTSRGMPHTDVSCKTSFRANVSAEDVANWMYNIAQKLQKIAV